MMPSTLRQTLFAILAATLSPHAQAAGLQAFRMPYNDTSAGITNLQDWQPAVAVGADRVTVDANGHYSVGGQRIRFIGVNITDVSAFPTHALAEAHAGRLARFGFNAVRMHHMEAPWAKDSVLIDYDHPAGTSRNLSSDRLERLHYFVAQLAARGIYTDINLLVSREFQVNDGLGAEVAQLGWKDQHILGFFVDEALALHKEYATKLLSAPNPYRGGQSLADDPAVAFVEIMNENGLLQKWYEGVLDKLPATYAQTLQYKWNVWLKNHYATTAELEAAWKAVNLPLGTELLANADFSGGMTSWYLEQHSTAVAGATAQTAFNGKPSLLISVTKAGTEGWHVQLTQSGLTLTKGKTYTLSFWGKAANATPISATLTRTGPSDYSGVMSSLSANLTTTWTQYTTTFQAAGDEPSLRLVFNGFGNRTASVQLADVRFQEGGKIGALPDGVTLEAGNVPTVLRNPGAASPTTEQVRDWITYIFSLEKTYWNAMHDHVKQTLGFKGIVWGSIISNSPTNEQAGFDAMDSHAYWQHPSWPAGMDWDPVNWTISNISMVNYPDGNTLTGIARQRVNGKPHNVTEYQHPSPNTYGSEGPVLAAAIGALQDWDSLWMFAYGTGTTEFATGYFDHGGHAGKMANNILAASLFRRGDVAAARRNYRVAMTPAKEVNAALTTGGAWSVADGSHLGVPAKLALESRISLTIGDAATGLDPIPAAPAGTVFTSDTDEVVWDTSVANKGVVTVNTPLTKAVVGFVNGRSFQLGDVTLSPGTTRQDWCTLGISLRTGPGFGKAGASTGFIVATGDQENSVQVWKDASKNSIGNQWGTAPVVVEVIPATVTLPYPSSLVHVWSLDGSGQRLNSVPVRDAAGKARFDLGASGATLWYEFSVDAGPASKPTLAWQPKAAVIDEGGTVTLSVSADGNPSPSFQWYHDDVAIPGATAATLTLPAAGSADLGAYHVVATNTAGTATSRKATVAFRTSIQVSDSLLTNVSTRANVGTGDHVMIAGFVVNGARDVLVRGSGPILGFFGVGGVLPDPMLDTYSVIEGVQTPFRSNDDWVPEEIGALSASLGAFSFSGYPKEAGAKLSLTNGAYTAVLSGVGQTTGVGLVEVYDAGAGTGRIVNLSTRADIGSGVNSLFVGFAISGAKPKHVLLRGVGPTLGLFSVPGVVADPKITLFNMVDGVPLALTSNDDWQDAQEAALTADFATGITFAFPQMSRDAALDVWLEPGLYAARLESKGEAGPGLVEVYELN